MPVPKLIFALLLVSAWVLGLGGISFYTPALLDIQHSLATSTTLIKLTISYFILGKGISMLVAAPFADSFRKKPLFLLGLSVFTAGSLVCLLSPNIHWLLLGRFLEGCGVSLVILTGRSLVNEQFVPNQAANLFSIIFIGNALAITCMPILAAYLISHFNWRTLFLVLSVYGFLVIILNYFYLPASAATSIRKPSITNFLQQARTILTHRSFLGYMLALSLMDTGEKVLTTNAPFIFIQKLGFSKLAFGYLQGALWGAHLIGLLICSVLVLHKSLAELISWGAFLCIVAAILMAITLFVHAGAITLLIVGIFFFMLSTGFIIPTALVGIARPFPKMIGVATALAMTIEFFLGSFMTTIVSHIKSHDVSVVISLASIVSIAIFCCWVFLLRNTAAANQ